MMRELEEFQPKHNGECIVNIGANQWVQVDKLFGPQCSSKIRVMHNHASCEWVVEEHNFNNDTWVERCRFYAQEFYKDEYKKED